MEVLTSSLTDNELVLKIAGVINSNSANDLYEQIEQKRNTTPGRKLILDFDEVSYLSSAGLRSILRLQKAAPLSISNVAPSVMEVFEMTGFTQIVDIHARPREISIDGAKVVGSGANGEVYQLPNETVVKLFAPGTPLSVVQNERELARQSLIQGIPTAIAYDIVTSGDRYGTVYEIVDSLPLSELLTTHPNEFDDYAAKYVALCKQIHSTRAFGTSFPNTKQVYHSYIDGCVDWYASDELQMLHDLVDAIPDRDTLIHGDFHANNIMVMDDELLLIDMGDVSSGHPAFDFLATAATQANLLDLNPEFAEVFSHMPAATIKRLWNYLLTHYFEERSEAEVARIDQQVRLLSKLKVALAPVVGRGLDPAIVEGSVNDAKQNLLPRVHELVGAIDW